MRFFYFCLMLVVLLTLVFCIRKIIKSSLDPSHFLGRTLFCAFGCVISNIALNFSTSVTLAVGFLGLCFILQDWMLFSLSYFCLEYVGLKRKHGFFEKLADALLIMDAVSFIVNFVTRKTFDVYIVESLSKEIFFQFHGTILFYAHLAIDYIMAAHCILFLCSGIKKSPSFYKFKYIRLLALFCVALILNGFYIFCHWSFDYSLILYAAIAFEFYNGPVKRTTRRLINKVLNLLVDKMDNGIVLFDADGNCVYVNSMVKNVFHTKPSSINDVKPLCDWIQKDEIQKIENYSEYYDFNAGDVNQNFKVSFNRILDKMQKFLGSYYIIQNITAETDRIKLEHERATRDKLTALYNREYFCEKVEHRLRFDKFTSYCLVVSDIVNFKLVNDLFGTAFGDLVLKRIADDLRSKANEDDIYGRLFNDHFALLMPSRRFSEKLFLEGFKSSFGYLNNFAYSLVCHIGVYDIDDRSLPVSVMCDRAFLALGTIKASFSNCVSYYNDALRKDVMKMQELMNDLPLALKYHELVMYLQPQISNTGKLLGAEALIRWHHHEKGVIAPTEFIKVIEKIGMISDVDMYVWEEACKKLAEWKKEGGGKENLYISINISPKDFYIVDVYDVLTKLVEKYKISPHRLNLEITETAIIMDVERQIKLIDKLRAYGFAIEMDDFGSGYSSLNMLKEINVDVLKIDMAFLQECDDHEKSRKILENIVHLAKSLGIKVVTEGVEKKEQVDFLTKAGCDIYQGFYYSKPVTVSEFENKFLKSSSPKM